MVDAVRYDEPGVSGTTVDVATREIASRHYQLVLPGIDAEVPGLATHFNAAATSTASTIKSAPGRLHAVSVANPNPRTCWLQIFDAASPTVGTTAPKLSIPIPPGDAADIFGQAGAVFAGPVEFGTQIRYAVTNTATGSGNPTAALTVNALYK